MKRFIIAGLLCLPVLFYLSCGKNDEIVSADLLGQWTHSEYPEMKLEFKNASEVLVNGNDFLYALSADSIQFIYNGNLFLYVIPTMHRIEFQPDKDHLMIEDMDNLWSFHGDQGENIMIRVR